jgi:hypothetical protein
VSTAAALVVTSEGAEPLFLAQNQIFIKVVVRSIANLKKIEHIYGTNVTAMSLNYHPPPFLLKGGPKLSEVGNTTPQPVLLFMDESQSSCPAVLKPLLGSFRIKHGKVIKPGLSP